MQGGLSALLAALAAAPTVLAAQIRSAVIYESYSFDQGLIFDRVSEMTVPLGFDLALGRFATLATSTGYARIDLRSTDKTQLADQALSGLLDTELRLSMNLVPGRLVAIMTGVIPTGMKTVQQSELSILGALSSDVIGFAAPAVGSGGSLGGGFAGAVPLGSFALGLGATYRLPLAYQPVIGQTAELKPGAEVRLRMGLQGPLSRRTYVRVAGIFASRSKDKVAAATQNGVGNRMIGYLALNQQIGSAALTLYGFDVFRGQPQLEASASGAAILPRGNLVAGGLRLALAFGRSTVFTPRVEIRISSAAPDSSTAALERLGNSSRMGFDLRHEMSRGLALVLQAGRVTGNVRQADTDIGFRGWRSALHFEITP